MALVEIETSINIADGGMEFSKIWLMFLNMSNSLLCRWTLQEGRYISGSGAGPARGRCSRCAPPGPI